jgi:hypothetical protein
MNMYCFSYRTAGIAALLTAAFCQAQQPAPMNIAARATPGDYQVHAKVGDITIAADFAGHSVPTPDAVFNSEDYITFEVAFFGPPGSHVTLRPEDFTVRVKGKKALLTTQPYALIFHGLKDPEWEETVAIEKANGGGKSSTSIGSGGGGGANDPPPVAPKMPIGTERRMEQRVQKAALPEGDRPLPEAGLIFFSYHGKTNSIQAMQLIYSGSAGKATLIMRE